MSHIVIQRPYKKGFIPKAAQLRQFGMHVLDQFKPEHEVTIRIVSQDEMRALNNTYRHKDKPTNVLSFKMDVPDNMILKPMPLGDVIICADVVNQEASAEKLPPLAHWAHMVIHGILHLLGHDHEHDDDTEIMQAIEIKMMQDFGFDNPYKQGKKE